MPRFAGDQRSEIQVLVHEWTSARLHPGYDARYTPSNCRF